MPRGAIAPHWIITAWIGIPRSGGFLLPSHPQLCRGRPRPPRPPASATWGAGLGTPHSAFQNWRGGGVSPPLPIRLLPSQNGRGGGVSPPLPKREGRRASVFAGARCTGTYYRGRPGGRCRSCGTVGPRLAGGSRAGAWRGCERWGSPPLFPVPGPAACLRAGGRLAPRGSVMTEPPRAAGGRRAEGWARNAFAVGCSGGGTRPRAPD